MAETWFNPDEGKLVIGWDAAQPLVEQGVELLPLPQLITSDEFPFKSGDFGSRRMDGWDRERLVELCAWAGKLVAAADDGSGSVLRQQHLKRLNILRLCPNDRIFAQKAAHLWQIRLEIGDHTDYIRGVYDDWSLQDFANNAGKLYKKLGRKPTMYDYDEAAARGEGPNTSQIAARVGGIRVLDEMLGFPDINSWKTDDTFIDWGARVMEANDDTNLTARMIAVLSKQRLGPSRPTIENRFGSLVTFSQRVHEQLARTLTAREEHRRKQLAAFDAIATMPATDVERLEMMDDEEKLCFTAKYQVAEASLARADHACLSTLALTPSNEFIKELRRHRRSVTAGMIEVTATTLDVFDDIWPLNQYAERLRITDEQLGFAPRYHRHKRAVATLLRRAPLEQPSSQRHRHQ